MVETLIRIRCQSCHTYCTHSVLTPPEGQGPPLSECSVCGWVSE